MDQPQQPRKHKPHRKHRYVISAKNLNLDKIKLVLMNVLKRDTDLLLDKAMSGQALSKEQSVALVNYLKLLRELQKDREKELEDLPTEELQKLLGEKK